MSRGASTHTQTANINSNRYCANHHHQPSSPIPQSFGSMCTFKVFAKVCSVNIDDDHKHSLHSTPTQFWVSTLAHSKLWIPFGIRTITYSSHHKRTDHLLLQSNRLENPPWLYNTIVVVVSTKTWSRF